MISARNALEVFVGFVHAQLSWPFRAPAFLNTGAIMSIQGWKHEHAVARTGTTADAVAAC